MSAFETTRKIVDAFYLKREKSEEYSVRLECKPNPLNYDGCDEVVASVVRWDRVAPKPGASVMEELRTPKQATVVLESGYAWTIEEALVKLAEAAGVSV